MHQSMITAFNIDTHIYIGQSLCRGLNTSTNNYASIIKCHFQINITYHDVTEIV